MSEFNKLIDSFVADREIVFKFFAVFSRFEYALKRTGFINNRTKAEANWDAFSNSIRGMFTNVLDENFMDAINFLQKAPPQTQIISANGLSWKDTYKGDGESNERYILRLVSTIRNNLFHGGKYPIGPIKDTVRNHRLLVAGLTVLEHCLKLNQEVKAIFENVE